MTVSHHAVDRQSNDPVPGEPFTSQEIAAFQADDRNAGRAIVTLMTCVFAIGLIIFATVTFVVAR
jgi:hypothetical protein